MFLKEIGVLIAGLVAGLLMVGCYGPGPKDIGTPGSKEVFMGDNFFTPTTRTITAGDTLAWINKGDHVHTVTSGTRGNPDGRFNKEGMGKGATFSVPFDSTGTFNYHCKNHPNDKMDGKIVVQ